MKQLKKYANQRFNDLVENLKSYNQLEDPEVLHNIRVEIKKIKALINLINFSVGKFKGHQQFIPFRTIFRRAGEIRQPEVFYKLLLLYQIGGVTDAQIPKSIKTDKLSTAFQKEVPKFISSVIIQRKKLKKYYDRISKIQLRKYLKKQKHEVIQFLFPDVRVKKLHLARKICKEIVYLHFVLPAKRDLFYTEVENIIGQWHDKQMLLPILRKNKATDDVIQLVATSKEDLIKLKKLVSTYFDE